MNTVPEPEEVDAATRTMALVVSIGGSLLSVIAIAYVTSSSAQ